MPGGYWNLDGWKGYEDARTLYITYIGNGMKLPEITDPATTAPGQRELIGTEIGNPDDDSVEEIKSTGEDTIDRLIDPDNSVEEIKPGGTKEKSTVVLGYPCR
jgi:hypothetical protein